MRMRLNKTNVDKLQPKILRYDVSDDQIRGLICRVNADGSKTMIMRYKRDGRHRSFKLGVIGGSFTVPAARIRAADVRATIDAGNDPARARETKRQAPTFADVADRYMREVCEPYCKQETILARRSMLRAHLLPAFGTWKIHNIGRDDVAALHKRIGQTTPIAANRNVAFLSVLMAKAEAWGLRPEGSNPCRGGARFRERRRERFLTPEERARLDAVLAESEAAPKGHPSFISPGAVAALRLLSLTGTRRNEITRLTWDEVDLDRACLRKVDTKTGARVIPLPSPAVELLRELESRRQPGVPWVCANQAGTWLQNLTRTWRAVRRRAGLHGVRLHDLRHSFASDALAAGVPLAYVGAMLGHRRPDTTARYAHLAADDVKAALETTVAKIAASTREGAERLQQRAVGDATSGGEGSCGGEVIPIGGRAKVISIRPRGKR